MVKRLPLATRAFGAEPDIPDIEVLADWIAEHRGTMADITTFRLERSLAPQLPAGIGLPCAGGTFYADRIRECIAGIAEGRATAELHADTAAVIEDAAGIVVQKKGAWCAMPAPSSLDIEDAFYGDADEWSEAICGVYRTLMRAMRDTGVPGHVLICEQADDAELAHLARQKVLFFCPEPDRETLGTILEHQHQVAVGQKQLDMLFDLMNEYTVRRIFLLDPDDKAVEQARDHFDPDQITGSGYCTDECDTYWNDIAGHSVYVR